MKEGQNKLTQNIKSIQAEMKEEFKGISAAKDRLKKVMQEKVSSMETSMDYFEEKVTLVQAKVLLMEGNFERSIQENIDQKLEQKFWKKIEEHLDMTIQEN